MRIIQMCTHEEKKNENGKRHKCIYTQTSTYTHLVDEGKKWMTGIWWTKDEWEFFRFLWHWHRHKTGTFKIIVTRTTLHGLLLLATHASCVPFDLHLSSNPTDLDYGVELNACQRSVKRESLVGTIMIWILKGVTVSSSRDEDLYEIFCSDMPFLFIIRSLQFSCKNIERKLKESRFLVMNIETWFDHKAVLLFSFHISPFNSINKADAAICEEMQIVRNNAYTGKWWKQCENVKE